MNTTEEHGLRIATEIFEMKCNQLVRHRNPNIYIKGNAEKFSDWFEDGLETYTIQKLGANAHPDLIVDGVGVELKSLKTNSQIQFNSTIPCGGFSHGDISGECYYAVARYSTDRDFGYLQDFTICDGDFFNHDREKAFSHLNAQETGFGDYGDGVVRHRKMYSFPSPVRTAPGISFISKFPNASDFSSNLEIDTTVTRVNLQGEEFIFYVYRHRLLGN
ncbi:hypothetical protein [Jeotgalibacillus terrae]|uniref:Restriction endonuclease n=1 Tax=Jeotgalibacillus terrae TaxID=587735 RepID=A0ABW5ZHE0_9BACL|nr:hypothetical protein [Jeotgalibacillus terrae]MBM7580809.1 hypothetical protein [Jeotgalibacillus terrae]